MRRMIEVSRVIDAPVARVFAFLARPAFTHVDMLDHLPAVDRDQLRASLDRLAEALEG